MPALEPYQAWFFFAADDITEVNVEYERVNQVPRPLGVKLQPSMTDPITVVAVEYIVGRGDYVWFLRDGMLDRRESWTIRAVR